MPNHNISFKTIKISHLAGRYHKLSSHTTRGIVLIMDDIAMFPSLSATLTCAGLGKEMR